MSDPMPNRVHSERMFVVKLEDDDIVIRRPAHTTKQPYSDCMTLSWPWRTGDVAVFKKLVRMASGSSKRLKITIQPCDENIQPVGEGLTYYGMVDECLLPVMTADSGEQASWTLSLNNLQLAGEDK